ncbi:MAG: hypothetical protein RLN62_04350 [Rickettsiales bacterium]
MKDKRFPTMNPLTVTVINMILAKLKNLADYQINRLADDLGIGFNLDDMICYVTGCSEQNEDNVLELARIYSAVNEVSSFHPILRYDPRETAVAEMKKFYGMMRKRKVLPPSNLPKEIYNQLNELTSAYSKWGDSSTVSLSKSMLNKKKGDYGFRRVLDDYENEQVGRAASELRETIIDYAMRADPNTESGKEVFVILSYLLGVFNSLKSDACNQENAKHFAKYLHSFNPGHHDVKDWQIRSDVEPADDSEHDSGNCFYDAVIEALGEGAVMNGAPLTVERLRNLVQDRIRLHEDLGSDEYRLLIESQLLTYVLTEDYVGLDAALAEFLRLIRVKTPDLKGSKADPKVTQHILDQIRESHLVDTYVNTIGENGNWADNVTIGVLAQVIGDVTIIIHNTQTGLETRIGEGAREIHLDYTGDHYIPREAEEDAEPEEDSGPGHSEAAEEDVSDDPEDSDNEVEVDPEVVEAAFGASPPMRAFFGAPLVAPSLPKEFDTEAAAPDEDDNEARVDSPPEEQDDSADINAEDLVPTDAGEEDPAAKLAGDTMESTHR